MGAGPKRRATAKGRVSRLLHFGPPPGAAPADTIDVTRADPSGLTSAEAAHRLAVHGANRLRDDNGNHPLAVLFRQFRSPMVLILLGAAILSFFLGEYDEASIVLFIVIASTGLGFYQEYRAGNAVAELRRRIAVTCTVLRDGTPSTVPAATLVPGDVLLLSAGSLIPADGVVLAATALHVDEAVLTGESFPVLKASTAPDNRAHMGTSVRSGEGRVLVTATGRDTEFGGLAEAVGALDDETSFARGTRRFGLLMTQIMLVLVTVVLVANVLLGRPVLDSLLFAAGAIAALGSLNPHLLVVLLTIAAVLGDAVNYQIGRYVGPAVFKKEDSRFFKRAHLEKTHAFYERYGGKTIIIARFVPIVRTFAPFIAGVGQMSYKQFALYNVVGAIAWVVIGVYAGYLFGGLEIVKKNFSLIIIAIVFISLLPAAFEYWRAKRHKKAAINPEG